MKKKILILSIVIIITTIFFACSEEREHTNVLDGDWGTVAPVENLVVTSIEVDKVRLNWSDYSNEDGYKFRIAKKTDSGDWDEEYAIVESGINSYTDESAEINSTLNYIVIVFYDQNISEEVEKSISNTFPAPDSITPTHQSLIEVQITWTDNSIGEDKFEIERKDAINSRLSFPIAILTLLLGAITYFIKDFKF